MARQTISKGRHVLGKLSRNCDKSAPRNCQAVLTWELEQEGDKLTFSAQGEVWNHLKTDIVWGGQCVEELAALFPRDRLAQRIADVHARYHLNGMNSGTPEQEAALERAKVAAVELLRTTNSPSGCFYDSQKTQVNWYVAGDYITGEKGAGWYGWACHVLKSAGLYEVPVTDELRASALGGLPDDATVYRYGTRWLYFAIPADVVSLIKAGFTIADHDGESEANDEPDDDPIARAGLDVLATFVPWSQSRNAGEKEPSLNWRITLTCKGRPVLLADYSAGSAHAPAYKNATLKRTMGSHLHHEAIKAECEKGRAVKSYAGGVYSPIYGAAIEPNKRDVIGSLLLDCNVLDAGSFADWAAEYGYDADSMKARAIYDECVARAVAFRAAVGATTFDELIQGAR